MGVGLLFIATAVALAVFGAERMPEIGALVGRAIREFNRNMHEVRRELDEPEREQRIDHALNSNRLMLRATDAAEPRGEPKRLL